MSFRSLVRSSLPEMQTLYIVYHIFNSIFLIVLNTRNRSHILLFFFRHNTIFSGMSTTKKRYLIFLKIENIIFVFTLHKADKKKEVGSSMSLYLTKSYSYLLHVSDPNFYFILYKIALNHSFTKHLCRLKCTPYIVKCFKTFLSSDCFTFDLKMIISLNFRNQNMLLVIFLQNDMFAFPSAFTRIPTYIVISDC